MDEPLNTFSQGVLEDFITQGGSQIHAPQFGQYLIPIGAAETDQTTSQAHEQVHETSNEPPSGLVTADSINFPQAGFSNFSITRQEVFVLSDVLGRIPQSFITGEESDFGQTMALTVVDDITPAAVATTSSQEEMFAQTTSETTLLRPYHLPPEVRGKRRRPKYSLSGIMFKRHPILKLSATGPLNRERSPYKWWCRVCRVELSLMS